MLPMNGSGPFYTLKGYSLMEHSRITSSMEDYLEMIYRFYKEKEEIRIKDLSGRLHVKPSSASKMAANLKDCGLISFEKYGRITLTPAGLCLGEYLLLRHDILNRFFCYLNGTEEELKQVEKVEHFMEERTVWNLKAFMDQVSIPKPPG